MPIVHAAVLTPIDATFLKFCILSQNTRSRKVNIAKDPSDKSKQNTYSNIFCSSSAVSLSEQKTMRIVSARRWVEMAIVKPKIAGIVHIMLDNASLWGHYENGCNLGKKVATMTQFYFAMIGSKRWHISLFVSFQGHSNGVQFSKQTLSGAEVLGCSLAFEELIVQHWASRIYIYFGPEKVIRPCQKEGWLNFYFEGLVKEPLRNET